MEKDPGKNPDANFLTRWSRRKRGVEVAEAAPARSETGAVVHGNDGDSGGDGEVASKLVLTDADMPPIHSLTEDSDFSGFLSPGVSEGLRRRALRKLFGSAVFNIRDGLDDYDDDFRNFPALGDIITSDMKHQMEREAEAKKAAEAEEAKEAAEAEEAEAAESDEEETDTEEDQAAETARQKLRPTPPGPAEPDENTS